MAELSTLARPYAKAAFEFADNANALSTWAEMLTNSAAVCSDSKVQLLLSNPAQSGEQISQHFQNLCGDVLDVHAQNFVNALAENKRLTLLPIINEQFQLLKAAKESVIDVFVETAFPLGEAEQQKLVDALTKSLNKDVKLEAAVDESLIGGAVIRAGDTVIDGSLKAKLSKLSASLSH